MSFLWPVFLLSGVLVPLFIAGYIWILRRRRKYAIRYSSLSIIRDALPKRSRWRQHLPFVLLMLSLTALAVASGRPTAEVEMPLSRTSIILAIDISRSMCATDVAPNRLTVAQEAALRFIEENAADMRIGIVAFAGFAEIVVPPSNDQEKLQEAVRNFTTSIGTAIGSATMKSIDAIAAINEAIQPSGVDLSPGEETAPTADNFFQPDIIVVLTDGANSQGPPPLLAALQAADRQIRIYTIGFGTTEPEEIVCSREQLGSDIFNDFGGGGFSGSFSGFGTGGFRRFLLLDEDTLMGMADITGGEYYRAENADQLFNVFSSLPSELVFQKEQTEISFYFAALGALFAILAIAFSFAWYRFP